jgi:hypothetical protein
VAYPDHFFLLLSDQPGKSTCLQCDLRNFVAFVDFDVSQHHIVFVLDEIPEHLSALFYPEETKRSLITKWFVTVDDNLF